MENNNMVIGQRIERARELNKLTMEDLAIRVGVAKSTIQRYEKGKITTIKLPVIESIARVLNVNPSWIIGKTDKMEIDSPTDLISVNGTDYRRLCVLLEKYNKFRKERGQILKEHLRLNNISEDYMGHIIRNATHRTGSAQTVKTWISGYREPDPEVLEILGEHLGRNFLIDWNSATEQVDRESWILGEILERFSSCDSKIRNAILDLLDINISANVHFYC